MYRARQLSPRRSELFNAEVKEGFVSLWFGDASDDLLEFYRIDHGAIAGLVSDCQFVF